MKLLFSFIVWENNKRGTKKSGEGAGEGIPESYLSQGQQIHPGQANGAITEIGGGRGQGADLRL